MSPWVSFSSLVSKLAAITAQARHTVRLPAEPANLSPESENLAEDELGAQMDECAVVSAFFSDLTNSRLDQAIHWSAQAADATAAGCPDRSGSRRIAAGRRATGAVEALLLATHS